MIKIKSLKRRKVEKEKKTTSETKADHHADNVDEDETLDEVVVEGNKLSPLLATQTGKRTLQQKDIKTEFSLLSSPDLVKDASTYAWCSRRCGTRVWTLRPWRR
jgi:hypothetical protein